MSQVSGYNTVGFMGIIRAIIESGINIGKSVKYFVKDITNNISIENNEDISEIIKEQDSTFINAHEKQIQKVFIPLDNTQDSIVDKAKVSEELAAKNAKMKEEHRQHEQLQIGDE